MSGNASFLKAEWRKLAMANYAVEKDILNKYLPYKTELDLWDNTCYLSLVGFMFLNTTLKGIKIPFHSNFEEVNLRFYVRYKDNHTWKRGVVFIKEIVPKPALTLVANAIYKENYETMPMSHTWNQAGGELEVEYKWKKGEWNSFKILAETTPKMIGSGTEEEFITEHYWGYTYISSVQTSEYEVQHPPWEVYHVKEHNIDVDFGKVYGSDFEFLSREEPKSVFLAEGSEIVVKAGTRVS